MGWLIPLDTVMCCSVCVYVAPRPDLKDDAWEETLQLTVVNGQLVCVRHVPMVQGNSSHSMALAAAVRFESKGELTDLAKYQDWRGAQDERRPTSAEGGDVREAVARALWDWIPAGEDEEDPESFEELNDEERQLLFVGADRVLEAMRPFMDGAGGARP